MKTPVHEQVKRVLALVFGRVRWDAPDWSRRSASFAARKLPRDRKKAGLLAGASVAVIAVAFFGWSWWKDRPQPELCAMTVQAPMPPDYTGDKRVSPLRVNFGCSAAPLDRVGKAPAVLPELSPSPKGAWTWESDRALVFRPEGVYADNDWELGPERYTLEIPRKTLADGVKLKESELRFGAYELAANMTEATFVIDAKNPSLRRVSASIFFNWAVKPESFKKAVRFQFTKRSSALISNTEDFPFTVTFDPTLTRANLISDNIPVPTLESSMRIEVRGFEAGRNGWKSDKVVASAAVVPGREGYFKIQSPSVVYARNERFEPEQALVLGTNLELPTEDVAKALKVWLLPNKHPKKKTKGDYSWSSFAEVTSEILASSTPVELSAIPTENPLSRTHGFRFQAPAERYLYAQVDGGLKAFGDYALGGPFLATVPVGAIPKELRILGEGNLLSLSGDRKLQIAARGVKRARIEVSRIQPDHLNHFVQQLSYVDLKTAQIYQNATDAVAERFETEQPLSGVDPAKTEYFALDFDQFLSAGKRGLFYVRLYEKDGPLLDQRMILVTDLGFLVKTGAQGTRDVFVQNLKTGQAVAGASVEVLGANGQPALSVQTDADGRARLPNLKDFRRERQPVAFTVRQGESLSFLPYQSSYRQLSMGRFDTSGVFESTESDALTAMLFSDRGIYRPGETVTLGAIVRARNLKAAHRDVPLTWIAVDSRGTEVQRGRIKASTGRLYSINFPTREASATGTWEVRVAVPVKNREEVVGSTTVRVEEFQPDRMRISSRLSSEDPDGWVSPDELSSFVTLQNLFGTAAQGRRIKANVRVSPLVPRFRKLPDYDFAALHRKEESTIETPLTEQLTDKEGKATFPLELSALGGGMYFLRFEAEGFDSASGGRSVLTASSTLASRHAYLVGMKADGALSYVPRGAERSVHLVAVNSKIEKTAVADAQVEIVENRYVSVLLQDYNGNYKYQSVLKEIPVSKDKLALGKDGHRYKLPTDKPGDFALIVRNAQGQELNRKNFTVVGEGIAVGRLDRNAELQLLLSKTDYKPGEEIEMQVRAPYAGSGLITIERDQVYSHKWFRASGPSTQSIRIPEGLEGNAYVSVSFLRDSASRDVYMSPLSYATAPFFISRDAFVTKITLQAPERVKPGEKLRIRYSTNRPTDLVLWGVDEGILQVARYQAPSPLDYFFRKKALQVETFQILDLLLPEYSVLKSLLSAGGDEADSGAGRNLNPFRRKSQPPVAFWSGVLKADASKKEYVYDVPEYYNGNVVIHAVASESAGMGLEKTSTLVRGDLVITPTVPLVAAPGDEFDVSVSVANQAQGSGPKAEVELALEADAAFETIGPASVKFPVAEGDEGTQAFRLRARGPLGSKKLRFKAAAGGKSAGYGLEVSVRPATPYSRFEEFRFTKALPQSFELASNLLPDLKKNKLLVSPNPLDLAVPLMDFLEGYPYGCTEQVLSRALSQMVMKTRLGGGKGSAPSLMEGFEVALGELRMRQQGDGGFALYSGGSTSQLLASVWALQYLVEAKERGAPVPEEMLAQALQYAQNLSLTTNTGLADARLMLLAQYLVARSGLVPRANLVEFETQALAKNKSWLADSAAVWLAGTYKLLKQDERGEKLIRGIAFASPIETGGDWTYNELVRNSSLLLVVARHYPKRLTELLSEENLLALLKPMQEGRVQTLSAGLTLLALDAVGERPAGAKPAITGLEFTQTVKGQETALAAKARASGGWDAADPNVEATRVTAKGSASAPFLAALFTAGFEKTEGLKEIKQGLEVARLYRRADGKDLAGAEPVVKQDETLEVKVRLRSLAGTVTNVAVVDLLPSGFELVLDPAPQAEESPEESGVSEEGEAYEEGARLLRSLLVPTAYAQSSSGQISAMLVQAVDRREDRVVLYATATPAASEYSYRVKAVSRGTFVVPPPFAEAMYDRRVRYRGVAGKIKVEKP
jgi:uncharacterized protein YfaS (alpha-2-macroglobulin family)